MKPHIQYMCIMHSFLHMWDSDETINIMLYVLLEALLQITSLFKYNKYCFSHNLSWISFFSTQLIGFCLVPMETTVGPQCPFLCGRSEWFQYIIITSYRYQRYITIL